MALVVEDGSGMANADSFVTVEATDAFWSARNVTEWTTASTQAKEAALRATADYLAFAYDWPGQPKSSSQSLCWPRAGAVDQTGDLIASDEVPVPIERACFVLAREALTHDLLRETSPDDIVTEESVSISGAISESRKYDRGNRRGVSVRRFSPVDAILSQIMRNTRGGNAGMRTVGLIRK